MGKFLAQAYRSGKELLATTTYDALWISYYLFQGSTRPGPEERSRHWRKSWSKEGRVLIAIVRDLDVVPDDPDPVDLAVAPLPPSEGLVSMWVRMYYPPDWSANDASATSSVEKCLMWPWLPNISTRVTE